MRDRDRFFQKNKNKVITSILRVGEEWRGRRKSELRECDNGIFRNNLSVPKEVISTTSI